MDCMTVAEKRLIQDTHNHCPATIFLDILAALFWPAPSGHRGRENRRVTDAVTSIGDFASAIMTAP